MPQISPTEFYKLPLRVHAFLADVPLHDVWAVDLLIHRDGVTLSGFLHRASQGNREMNRLPPAARALFRFRFVLGRIFGLEAEPKDALAASFGSRLTAEDRAHSCGQKSRQLSILLCGLRSPENVDHAVLHGLNRSVPKMDYLSGLAEKNSWSLGSQYLTKQLSPLPRFCR